jgi:anti-sigma regulatory factor (Ser/Thr protein kinase)
MLTNHQASGFSKSLTIANQFGELARVASWLEQMSQHYQLAEPTVFKLDMVLNRDDHVLLEIIDDGMAFNPFAAAPLPEQLTLESASIDGRGIQLIRSFTDAQDYQRINNTNTMRVTIHKSPEPSKHRSASFA